MKAGREWSSRVFVVVSERSENCRQGKRGEMLACGNPSRRERRGFEQTLSPLPVSGDAPNASVVRDCPGRDPPGSPGAGNSASSSPLGEGAGSASAGESCCAGPAGDCHSTIGQQLGDGQERSQRFIGSKLIK